MDKKDKIDKTKANLGVSNLDNATKKDLFNKFVQAGGEVISDKDKRKNLIIDRKSQRQFQDKLEAQKQKLNKDYATKKPISRQAVTAGRTNTLKSHSDDKQSIFTIFLIKFRLWLFGIADLSSLYFKYRFLERFNNTYKPAIIELQMIYLDIFRKNPKVGNEIIDKLDKSDPLQYELILMTSDLYDKMNIDEIVDHYVNFPDIPKKVSELKEPLMSIYRRLYMLRQFENYINRSFDRAIDLLSKNAQDKTSGLSSMRRKVRSDVYLLLNKLLPRLHNLFCYYHGRYYEIFDSDIEVLLSIKGTDKPGNRKFHEKKEEDDEVAIEGADSEEAAKIPEHIKKGLQMMYRLNLDTLRKDFDKYGRFNAASDSDKVLITYLLYHEFDREYSFILTTNKIKYNLNFNKQGMVDFRQVLHGLYDEMRKCDENFKIYTEILDNYEKLKNEKPASNTQYIEFTKRVESLNKQRLSSGRGTLNFINDFFDRLIAILTDLITDLNGNQTFIENPQDIIEFESHIEGLKKMNGKKVYEVINAAYQYAGAFSYRLGPDGDLSGSIEFKEGEVNKNKPKTKEENHSAQSDKSVLEELDDML